MSDDNEGQPARFGRPLLGRILGQKFNLPDSKLNEALAYQREKGGRLGEALLHLRMLREEELLEALALQFELPWMPRLETAEIDHALIKRVPIGFARRYRVLPLREEHGAIVVATSDPLETVAIDDLRLLLGMPVRPVLTTGVALLACLNRVYDEAASPAGAEQVMEDIAATENLPPPSVAIRGRPGSQRSPQPGLRAFSLLSGWLARLGRVPDSPGSSPTTPHLKENMNLPTSLSRLSSLILPFVAVAAHAVSLSPTSLTLLPGNSANIVVSSVRGTATLKNSNPAAVAASLAAGTISVTANAAGVATLSVTDRSGTKTAKVTVKPPLGVSPGSVSLLVGQSATLTVSNAIS